jgi:hypothetical protein
LPESWAAQHRLANRSRCQPTAEVSMMGHEQHDFYKVNSLTNLDTASPVEGTIVWDAPRSPQHFKSGSEYALRRVYFAGT